MRASPSLMSGLKTMMAMGTRRRGRQPKQYFKAMKWKWVSARARYTSTTYMCVTYVTTNTTESVDSSRKSSSGEDDEDEEP